MWKRWSRNGGRRDEVGEGEPTTDSLVGGWELRVRPILRRKNVPPLRQNSDEAWSDGVRRLTEIGAEVDGTEKASGNVIPKVPIQGEGRKRYQGTPSLRLGEKPPVE